MAVTTTETLAPGSLEALKRVKATETEWDTRLAAAREESETALRALRSDRDAAVKATQSEADRERSERVERARAEIATETGTILAEGREAAERAAHGEGRRPSDRTDEILDVVLGSFGKD